MKEKEKYEQFILNLKNLNNNKKLLLELKDELDLKWYRLSGVSGVDSTKISIEHPNTKQIEMNKHEQREEIEKLTKKFESLKYLIEDTESKLNMIPETERNYYYEIYVNRKSFYKIASKNLMSIGQLQYLMKEAYKKLDL